MFQVPVAGYKNITRISIGLNGKVLFLDEGELNDAIYFQNVEMDFDVDPVPVDDCRRL